MSNIKVVLLSLCLLASACTNDATKKINYKFYPEYFTGLETNNVTSYSDAVLDYDLTAPDNKNIHFKSCTQVESIEDKDVLISEYHLLTMLRLNCKALKKFTLATASEKTFLDEVLVKKDISRFPATAYPYVNEGDRLSRLNKKLNEYYKKLEVKISADGAIDVTTETDMLLYQVISTGDFNGDKVEDALIRIDWHVIDAFGKGSKLILITKMSASQDFEELSVD